MRQPISANAIVSDGTGQYFFVYTQFDFKMSMSFFMHQSMPEGIFNKG
jgi:hypothetical protein